MLAGASAVIKAVRRQRAPLGVLAVLALALSVVYANVVFGGRSLVATENYNVMHPPPSEEAYGPGHVPHQTWQRRGLLLWAGQFDPGAAWCIWEPGAHFLLQTLRRGELPFWNPYVGAGAPAMAGLSETHFFPPYLLMVLLGAGSLAKNAYALSLLLAAGFFTYAFLRRHELGHVGAAFGGLAFMLSGTLNQMIVALGGQTVACLPFTLWVTRLFLDRPDWRRLALLAASYAVVALSSSPPLLMLSFGFAAVYALWELARQAAAGPLSESLRTGALYALGAALALGLVAFYYLPAAELISISTYVGTLYAGAAREQLPPISLLQLLSPDLLGGGAFYTVPAVRDPVPWQVQAIGVTALFGALLAGRGGAARRSSLRALALLACLAVASKVIGLPPLQWLSGLPVLRNVHFAVYASFLMHFLLALLAGIGCDRLWRGELRKLHAAGAFGVLALALLALYKLARTMGLTLNLDAQPVMRHWVLRYLALWLCLALLAALAVWAAGTPRRRLSVVLACGGLFAMGVAEGVLNLTFPRQKRFDVWRHPVAHVRALQALQDGRRFADYRVLPANTNAAFGIAGIDSLMTFNSERATRLYRRYFEGPPQQFMREMSVLPSEALLDRAGVGVLAVRTVFGAWLTQAVERGYEQRFQDEYATLFRRQGGARYLVTPSYRVLSAPQALEEVATAPASELLLEEAPAFASRPFDTGAGVEVTEFRNNSVSLVARSPGPALLYCAESHMPGWEARVNGRPARILQANYAFRAVELPAGRSTVVLRYVPPGLVPGLALSAASLLALGFLALRRRPA